MKLINLNVECGSLYEPLMEFIKKHSTDTDIFCLQEVFDNTKIVNPVLKNPRVNLFSEIKEILPDFDGFHVPAAQSYFGGLAIFIKKSLTINKIEDVVLFKELSTIDDEKDANYFAMGKNLQKLEFKHNGKIFTILNFHGIWIVNGKGDTKKRIEQSEQVRKIFDESNGAKILCGDLNVERDTESMAILDKDNRNLIQEYNINSTRSLSKKRPEVVDYIIVSPDVDIVNFEVMPDEVSDHLAMSLVFN
jgi:endonuclease/exonuclease/phosphatase family metal-dependent hydrolase